MADVTVISSSIVRPQNLNQSCRTKIHPTPFDLKLLYVDYPQRGLLFHKPDPETHLISRLKTSLSTALDIYFPFSGRLVKEENLEDNTVSFYIDCDEHGSSGAKFVHAESKSLSVSDILQLHGSVPDFMSHFFPSVDVKSINGLTEPLLALQVTEVKMVFSSVSVIITWSLMELPFGVSLILGPRYALMIPTIRRTTTRGWFLDGISFPIRVPASETAVPSPRQETSLRPTSNERVFHFTKRNLSNLKAKANNEAGSSDLIISSLQALSAHLWRSTVRHSGMSRDEETHCKLTVDMRQRLNPPLEKECFGNLILLGVATVTVGELLDNQMGWAALQISKMVHSQTDEKFKTFAKNWVRDVKILEKGCGSPKVFDSVVMSSSPWFDVYGNDFGWGKPIAARAGPGNSMRGKLVLFQGIEEGSIAVHATLCSHVLVKLLADVEFLENVTIT
ncbi:unnamed protein product [Brassica oleracea var. botrytis]|uniref:Acetyltransferase n=1 Tax=Brassica oleracea TaxID=3712 RepID=A0A3P6DWF0_BRAOL|nr:unnamed protein product [Brassica oleracea]